MTSLPGWFRTAFSILLRLGGFAGFVYEGIFRRLQTAADLQMIGFYFTMMMVGQTEGIISMLRSYVTVRARWRGIDVSLGGLTPPVPTAIQVPVELPKPTPPTTTESRSSPSADKTSSSEPESKPPTPPGP